MNLIFDPSLVLYLPLYELAGGSFMSRDAWGHLCTVTGALWRPDGRDFDGVDDYIGIAGLTPPGFPRGNQPFTMIMWLKVGEIDNRQAFYRDGRGVDHEGIIFDLYGDNKWRMTFWGVGRAESLTPTPVIGNWYQIVGVYDQAKNYLYCNGELKDSVNYTTANLTSTSSVTVIGDYVAGGGLPWKGSIGEVWVYNRALSPLEIQQNYLATKWRY